MNPGGEKFVVGGCERAVNGQHFKIRIPNFFSHHEARENHEGAKRALTIRKSPKSCTSVNSLKPA